MAKHETKELLVASPEQIATIAEHIKDVYVKKNYTVEIKYSENKVCDILMSENKPFFGASYKLHITMKPHGNSYIDFYAGNYDNVFNWAMLILFIILPITWPLAIALIFHIIRWSVQNNLDDETLKIAKEAIK